MGTVVVALGGNAIAEPGQPATFAEQNQRVATACEAIFQLISDGHRVVVTHGNGPQVGAILLQNEEAAAVVPPMPLDVCGAESQGMIGYMLQQGLRNYLRSRGRRPEVVTLITQVEVDSADPSFHNPTKPIGPLFSEEKARAIMAEGRFKLKEDAGRGGWRRVVPSPEPKAIVERSTIRTLLRQGRLVIASGGGGIPVVRGADGRLQGVEAVVDKDLAAERLAQDVRANLLLILTDVAQVYVNFKRPDQRALGRITVAEGRGYQAAGQFTAGSMGPKIEAALRFAASGRGEAVIGRLEEALAALRGESGTRVIA
jgi:carbamate kinase